MSDTNKSIYILWIDREHAKLFQFSREKMERRQIQSRHIDHPTHQFDHLDQERQENRLYKDVADQLKLASRILILGPGVAKYHFQNYLIEHEPALARVIVGCETVDHPTDGQIAEMAQKFFKTGLAFTAGRKT